jgi:hypothetical protein
LRKQGHNRAGGAHGANRDQDERRGFLPPLRRQAGKGILDRFERGTLRYLTAIAGDKFRQVLLVDGPAVLGWEKWREIDARYFGVSMQAPMDRKRLGRLSPRELEALGHLIAGAISEAALVCATSDSRPAPRATSLRR